MRGLNRTAVLFFLKRAAVGWAVSCSAFGLLPRSRRRARSCFSFGLFFLNRAAVGWAVSCSAFGFLPRSRRRARSCFAFGLLPRSRRRARSCFTFGLFIYFLVLSVTISKPPRMMFRG